MNHYWLRSWQDFHRVKRCRNRAQDSPQINDNRWMKMWEVHDSNELFEDEISQRFGSKITV